MWIKTIFYMILACVFATAAVHGALALTTKEWDVARYYSVIMSFALMILVVTNMKPWKRRD